MEEVEDLTFEDYAEDYFHLYDTDSLVLILPYDDDMDDRLLTELRPRYLIMYEPNPAFVRRVEVYRATHPTRSPKVYFLYYANSVEEQRYLSAVRREKDAFTRLIREKGNMALVLQGEAVEDPQEFFLRTVNTRIAGGGRIAATAEPPRVLNPTSLCFPCHPSAGLVSFTAYCCRSSSTHGNSGRRCRVYCMVGTSISSPQC